MVDALCSRLRHLQRHPRAPQLLAALLRRAGVAPELLPLMAEPLQRALQVGAGTAGVRKGRRAGTVAWLGSGGKAVRRWR